VKVDQDDNILCPVCDFLCVHPVRVDVYRGTQPPVTVRKGGVQIGNAPKSSPFRGAVIQIFFICESGHRFIHRMQFHKGSTLSTVVVAREGDEYSNDNLWGSDDIETLWRD